MNKPQTNKDNGCLTATAEAVNLRGIFWRAINAGTKAGLIDAILYDRKNFLRRANAAMRRNISEPGDCGDDCNLLVGLAVAESQIGRGAGWIPEVQRIGCAIAKMID